MTRAVNNPTGSLGNTKMYKYGVPIYEALGLYHQYQKFIPLKCFLIQTTFCLCGPSNLTLLTITSYLPPHSLYPHRSWHLPPTLPAEPDTSPTPSPYAQPQPGASGFGLPTEEGRHTPGAGGWVGMVLGSGASWDPSGQLQSARPHLLHHLPLHISQEN